MANHSLLINAAFLLSTSAAFAQSGVLDQVSPAPAGTGSAGFNWSASSLTWQQQVRAGIAGQLEGVELFFSGNPGAHFDVRLRVGDGWNTGPVVWSAGFDITGTGNQSAFFDMTSASVFLAVGDTFVWEVQGNDTGAGGRGSYVAPPGAPLYAENLYLNMPGCFADCGWRLAFNSYMLTGGPGTSFCFGDGTGTTCPCANPGAAGAGCATSASSGGVLTAGGSSSAGADDLTFTCDGMVSNQPALLFSANDAINGGDGIVFGDGLRCAGNTVKRLGVMVPDINGSASWGPGLGAAGGWNAGDTRRFQCWFRDPAGPCGFGFNLSQGVEILFGT